MLGGHHSEIGVTDREKSKEQENNLMTSVDLGPDPKPDHISRKISIELIGLWIRILKSWM